MRAALSRGLSAVVLSLALLAFAPACGYDPHPADGVQQCGSMNSCPDNYSCMSGRCWRNGAAGSTGRGGSGGSGGSTGGTGGGSGVDKFIGSWAFDAANTTRVRTCTDGTNETLHPYADGFDITAGSSAALVADFYCPWNLDVTAAGTTTAIRSGQMCSHPDPNDATITFTWKGEAFTFMTTTGTTGTADISLPYNYTTSSGSGSCTMHFTGPVTKQ